MTDNNAQAAALAAALMPHLIESLKKDILPGLIEEQIGPLSKNAKDLLDEVKTARAQKDDFAKLVEDHEKSMADTRALLDKKDPLPNKGPVLISREDALNVQKYQEAKKLAAVRGTAVQIEGRAAPEPKADPRTHVQTDTHFYVAASAARDTPTYRRLRAQAADARLEFAVVKELPDAVS